jgi:hypothetical protein
MADPGEGGSPLGLALRAIEDYRAFAAATIQRFWRGHASRSALRREVHRATCAARAAAPLHAPLHAPPPRRRRPVRSMRPRRSPRPRSLVARPAAGGRGEARGGRGRGGRRRLRAPRGGARDPGRVARAAQHARVPRPQGPAVLQVGGRRWARRMSPGAPGRARAARTATPTTAPPPPPSNHPHHAHAPRAAGDPAALLRTVNPREAALLDAAAGSVVRFRLGGPGFPPAVLYKIFTRRPVAGAGGCPRALGARVERGGGAGALMLAPGPRRRQGKASDESPVSATPAPPQTSTRSRRARTPPSRAARTRAPAAAGPRAARAAVEAEARRARAGRAPGTAGACAGGTVATTPTAGARWRCSCWAEAASAAAGALPRRVAPLRRGQQRRARGRQPRGGSGRGGASYSSGRRGDAAASSCLPTAARGAGWPADAARTGAAAAATRSPRPPSPTTAAQCAGVWGRGPAGPARQPCAHCFAHPPLNRTAFSLLRHPSPSSSCPVRPDRQDRARLRKQRRRAWLLKLYARGGPEAAAEAPGGARAAAGGGARLAGAHAPAAATAAAACSGLACPSAARAAGEEAGGSSEAALLRELEARLLGRAGCGSLQPPRDSTARSGGSGSGRAAPPPRVPEWPQEGLLGAPDDGGAAALLRWCEALDFDAYAQQWLAAASSGPSDAAGRAAAAGVPRTGVVKRRLAALGAAGEAAAAPL